MDLSKNDMIPLRCDLCPKQPSFSDVSHLLTHISSKSHLSHRFRTEIRAPKDPVARETLAQYDDWYDQHGIQELLAERMAAKEKKATKRSRPATASDNPRPVPKRSKAINTEPEAQPRGLKAEPESYSQELKTELGGSSHGPPLALWYPAAASGPRHMHEARNEYSANNSSYQAPGLGHGRDAYMMLGSPENPFPPQFNPWYSETETTGSALPSETATDVTAEDENNRSKLKGALWPGMSVFDSATEAQKRKRNQRKDESVLRLMEQTSAGVEPTEIVWSGEGEFHKMRDIYASPSLDGSPEPSPNTGGNRKKKGTRRAAAAQTVIEPRQTRASARKARAKGVLEVTETGTSDIQKVKKDQEGQEGQEHLVQRSQEQISQGTLAAGAVPVPAQMHGLDDDYNIFHDPLAPSPGQFDLFLNDGPYYFSPVLTRASEGRTESPSKGGSFDPHRRPALQPMNSNMPIPSPTPRSLKPSATQYFHGGLNTHMPSFFHQPNMGPSSFNPLSMQGRAGYPYSTFSPQNFGDDTKPEATTGFNPMTTGGGMAYNPNSFGDDVKPEGTGFHPINTTSGMVYNPFLDPADNNPFKTTSAIHHGTPDYNI